MLDEWQTVQTLIRRRALWRLIRVYTVISCLSVQILRENTIIFFFFTRFILNFKPVCFTTQLCCLGMANNEDPDHTAFRKSSVWIYTVYLDMSVRIFRVKYDTFLRNHTKFADYPFKWRKSIPVTIRDGNVLSASNMSSQLKILRIVYQVLGQFPVHGWAFPVTHTFWRNFCCVSQYNQPSL